MGELEILMAEGQNLNGMPINKRVTEVERSIGAIVWNSYEALLQSMKQHWVDTSSTPFGKFYYTEEKLSTALERLAMGIREIRHIIVHGSQDNQTINNMKFIEYQATIQHIKDSAARSKREREGFPPPTL